MNAKAEFKRERPSPTKVELELCVGKAERAAGKLVYFKDGRREFSQFAYAEEWWKGESCFDISPDLAPVLGYQLRKAPSKDDSCFFLALADTEPDSWGRRVIARDHAKRRKEDASLGELTELDYLCAVDDFSRIGALRLRAEGNQYLRSTEEGKRTTPPLLELKQAMDASHRVEMSQETAEDLKYLRGKATSLGGLRPKCSILDTDGQLALGKFPSVKDDRSVVRGEVLALKLASLAGIETAHARVELIEGTPVAVVKRFDRTRDEARVPYISGSTLLQASRNDEHAYTEVVDVMRSKCVDFDASAKQLWRRLVLNHLLTNVDDHLQNIGFLYVGRNMWKLSPAFDINPFPDKDRESKTWLSEDTGPVVSVEQLLGQAERFQLKPEDATAVLGEVVKAVEKWRDVAVSHDVGMSANELNDFAPAFEHSDLEDARRLAGA
jgi:serine/threonine-protein kinase HipA